jgi:hypothetical protein
VTFCDFVDDKGKAMMKRTTTMMTMIKQRKRRTNLYTPTKVKHHPIFLSI